MSSLFEVLEPLLAKLELDFVIRDAIREVASDIAVEVVPLSAARNEFKEVRARAKSSMPCVLVDHRGAMKPSSKRDVLVSAEGLVALIQGVAVNVERRSAGNSPVAVLETLEPVSPALRDLSIRPRREEEVAGGRGRLS